MINSRKSRFSDGLWGGKLLIIALFCIFTMIIQPFYAVIFIGLLGRILLEECNIKLLMLKNWEKGILVLFSLLLLNIKNLSLNLQNNIELVIQAFGAVIIVILAFKNNFCFLSWKCLVNRGNISYEFYLVHFIILLSFRYVGMNSYIYILKFLKWININLLVYKYTYYVAYGQQDYFRWNLPATL